MSDVMHWSKTYYVLIGMIILLAWIIFNASIHYSENMYLINTLNATIELKNSELENKSFEIFSLKAENTNLNNNLIEINHKLSELLNKYENISSNLEDVSKKYEMMKGSYAVKKVTKEQVMDFLSYDDTNSFNYSEDFDCTQFSNMLVKNALKRGMLACIVEIDFNKTGHDLVAFNTDEGIIYVEPQDDRIMTPLIGLPYWDRRYYTCDYDDTIVRITDCFG